MSKGSPKQRLIAELAEEVRINGTLDRAFDNVAAARLEVNATDLSCLDVIQRAGGLTAGELARETGLSTGAVTAVVDRLEGVGYARRVRDRRDRRRVMVEVTPHFHQVAWRIWGPLQEEWDAVMRRYTTEELRLVLDFIRAGGEVGRRHIERVRGDR